METESVSTSATAVAVPPGSPTSPDAYSPGDVLRMIEGQVNALAAQFGTLGVVDIVGRLGPVGATKYNKHYGVELRESGGSIDALKLDIPTALNPAIMAGKTVKVRGKLEAKKGCYVSLSVFKMRTVEDASPEALAEEKSIREILRLPNTGTDVFPSALEGLNITTIAALNSQVLDDFRNQIADVDDFLDIEALNANFLVAESLIDAIRNASGEVVVLLRGGGADGDLEVFNQPAVLEAWRAKDAFKITAIGHTKNSTLLDRISHKVADTPTAAGKFLADRIDDQVEMFVCRRDASTANDKVTRQAEAFQQQIAAMQSENAQLQNSLRALEVEQARPTIPWMLLAAALAMAMGMILGWWLTRP